MIRAVGGIRRRIARILLRQPTDAIERAARRFSMGDPNDRARLSRLGSAFLSGYHTMLDADSVEAGFSGLTGIPAYERPFWAEGAAMALPARSYFDRSVSPVVFGATLDRYVSGFLYLGYVGLGFWFGFRHPRAPSRIKRDLAPWLDPLYLPLCYDGWGFKLGFFDWPARPGVVRRLDRCPQEYRSAAWQGFGRALYFVLRDDEARFAALATDDQQAYDLESGRSLALAFTRVDQPDAIARHLDAAEDERRLEARLVGTAWALTARYRGDRDYLEECLGGLAEPWRARLSSLPETTLAAERRAVSYSDWRERTARDAVARIRR